MSCVCGHEATCHGTKGLGPCLHCGCRAFHTAGVATVNHEAVVGK